MNKKTRSLVLTAVLIAITLMLGLLPIGFIQIVPGFVEITIMCLPVIVGSIVLGWRAGVALGAIFALTSIITSFRSPLGVMLLEANMILAVVLMVLPRLLVPITAFVSYRYLRFKKDTVNLGIACAVGSLTNTVLFLTMMNAMFSGVLLQNVFTTAAFLNGSIEAVVAVVVCVPVIRALMKSVPPIVEPRKTRKENAAQ